MLAALAAAQSPLEQRLIDDIRDYRLDDFSHIEAAFILSGADKPDTLQKYMQWYDGLVNTLRSYNFDIFDRVGTAAKIFQYLHGSWLITYAEESTTLLDVASSKEFNCVAGTILYNLVCEDMNLRTEAFETPTHTYTIFPNFSENIMVENTASYGFNITQNLQEYSKYLLQFYPQDKRYQIGLDRIYEYEQSKGRKITNTELLGLLAYNRAYFANQEQDYKTAYRFVRLAQQFNNDSRSNINFEIGLYYRWGRQLVERQQFNQAFEIFAEACTRYWDNKDFANNCRYTFQLAQQKNWQRKDWRTFRQQTQRIRDLDVFTAEDFDRLYLQFRNWLQFAEHQGEPDLVSSVREYSKDIFPNRTF